MDFKTKYTTLELSTNFPAAEKDKVILSNDAYSIGEMISELINKIEQTRVYLK